jgi:WbqC-like protein
VKIAIMQPYFFPYIGYFQLITAVDEFVIYDNIEYTKRGWINRNRILVNGRATYITLPLKRDSDFLDVYQRFLADSWSQDRKAMLNKIANAYRKAPNFRPVFPLIEKCILFDEKNLFQFVLNSVSLVNEYLQIPTPILVSSTVSIHHELKAKEKVVALCKARNAVEYLNPIGGVNLYHKDEFEREGIGLHFIKSNDIIYKQFDNDFAPWLSIIDVMMFNSREKIKEYLTTSYALI